MGKAVVGTMMPFSNQIFKSYIREPHSNTYYTVMAAYIYTFMLYMVVLHQRTESHRDIAVNIKCKHGTTFWNYEFVGPAYGNSDTFLFQIKEGFKCGEVSYGNRVIWSAVGSERAERILISGRGKPKKIVEIDLDNETVIFFYKKGRLGRWRVYDKAF